MLFENVSDVLENMPDVLQNVPIFLENVPNAKSVHLAALVISCRLTLLSNISATMKLTAALKWAESLAMHLILFKLPPYTLAGFDLATHSFSGRRRRFTGPRRQGNYYV
jgi:hypothetical protein